MDFRVMGLSEILKQIEEQKAELLSQYNLERAFDVPLNDLQTLLEQEAYTRAEIGAPPPAFEDFPAGLLEKMRRLHDFTFENEESRDTFEEWQERESDIRELFDFYSTWAHYFKGNTFLDFEQALELMRQIKSLEEMAQQIQSGQWTQIDPETLEQLLGNEAAQSLAILIQLPSELAKEGLIQFSKDGIDLTPRGIRSIGEMAFGDLYHMVKRDRQGSYRGNAPQSGEIEPDSSRPFTFGDRFDLDITRTLLKSVSRKQESS
jgi:hypothetical protein